MSLIVTKGTPIPTRFKIPETLEKALGAPQIPILRREQEQDAWCYAACAQMAIKYVTKKAIKQCQVARFVKGVGCCPPTNSECTDSGCGKNQLRPLLRNWDVLAKLTKPLLLSAVATEINAKPRRLMEAIIDWDGVPGQPSSHAVLIVGIDGPKVFLMDPLEYPKYQGWVLHRDLNEGFGLGRWAMTLVNLRKKVS